MGLDALKNKSKAMGKQSMAGFLKVNKYESPQMALNLIAHICTADVDFDVSPYFEKVCMEIDEMDKKLQDEEFCYSCELEIYRLANKILSTMSSTLKIAVAGGYSAGKSSLLNDITGVGDLLPTGIDPVSVVNTYLNCNSSNTNLVIRGENLRNKFVLLDDEVLACIQHASKSKTYIANVLNKIVIDVPSSEWLDGITFVDTPGYNNSSALSESDKDKAVNAMSECDAIFWCIDIESGTITKNDIDMLRQVEDKPIAILYTKMDKKPEVEIHKIVEDTERICLSEFGREKMPLAVMAVSCRKKEIYSTAGFNWNSIIKMVKEKSGTRDLLKMCLAEIQSLFDKEIDKCQKDVEEFEEKRMKAIKRKDECYEDYRSIKNSNNELKKRIKEILIDSYNEVMRAADKRGTLCSDAIDGWSASLDREVEWSKKAGFFSDTASLSKHFMDALKNYNRLIEVDAGFQYWNEDYRQTVYDWICEQLDENLQKYEQIKDKSEEDYQKIVEIKMEDEQHLRSLREYKQSICTVLSDAYNECVGQLSVHQAKLQKLETVKDNDIFSAISGDNMTRFLSCFSNGVDLNACNKEGYSPVTWAVRSGNNEMVKFFIDHAVDLSVKDGRGYNALETAVMLHYQDMCELLMSADNSLRSKSKPLTQLAENTNFRDWISQYV